MFLGVVPNGCITQIVRSIDFSVWPEIYVCCSGTFRFERAILQAHQDASLVSNDVSVFSVPLGRYVLGEETPIEFVGELARMEQLLEGRPYLERLAAIMVASDYAKYRAGKPNRFKESHARHYEEQMPELISATAEKLNKVLPKIALKGFYAGDWVQHMRNAIENGAGVVAFPPFYKGGYEKMFEFLNQNIKWDPPAYDLYDPKQLESLVDEVKASGAPYCILSDQKFEDHEVMIEFQDASHVPHFCYASTDHSSFRRLGRSGTAFKYKPVDVSQLNQNTRVDIVETTGDRMMFLKDVYLKKGIKHVMGRANYLVYLDGMLAGGIIYDLSKFGQHDQLYLLSDFSVTGRGRLAKLIAKLALSRTLIAPLERRYLWKFRSVFTTAFSRNAVSMKYRGVMELKSRKPAADPKLGNMINYEGALIDDTPEQVYRWWWTKHGRKALG